MKIICKLILDKRNQRKWTIDQYDPEVASTIAGPLHTGITVAIGEKYVDKLKYNVGERIIINSEYMIYHGGGYYLYNHPAVSAVGESVPVETKANPISLEHDGFYLDDKMYKVLERNIKKQINTLLLGPTGSGKTEVIQLICDKLDIPCSVYDMGALHDPIAGLLGVHRLEKGESIFDYSKFVSDVQKPGVIVLDELSRSPHSSLNILFPCLDSRRMLPVEIASSRGLRNVPVHSECTFIATANVGVEYTGTSAIDKALLNRFFLVEMPYLEPEVEQRLLVKRTGISTPIARIIADIANELRTHNKNGKIAQSVSTRETIMIGYLIHDGWEPIDAIKQCILPLYDTTDRDFVVKLVMSK